MSSEVRSLVSPGKDVTVGDEREITVKPGRSTSHQHNGGSYRLRLAKARDPKETYGVCPVALSLNESEVLSRKRQLYVHAVMGFETDDRTLFGDFPDWYERISALESDLVK